MRSPRVSIVTASFNQARFIRETIESVLAQSYAEVEHIVVDGMSTDDTPLILDAYTHLKVVREPDQGQADAINKGFRLATGDILAFLNSDDTLLPGALERVVAEIDPSRGRHVVMGRCRFVDENGRFLGVEHPSVFVDHADVLEIWNGHGIPQPAVFFTREAWERSGPMDPAERLVLDYDLFCRMSRLYPFHPVDQVFATYRLHASSKTSGVDNAKRLEESLRVSRKYWGPWYQPQRWRLEASYFAFRANRKGRAVRSLQHARELWRRGRVLSAVGFSITGFVFGPDVFLDTLLVPGLRSLLGEATGRIRPLRFRRQGDRPETSAWREFRGVHEDGWAGPELITKVDARPGHREFVLRGALNWRSSARIEVFVDGILCCGQKVKRKADFEIRMPMQLPVGLHEIRVTSSSWFVPDDFLNNGDYRPLGFRVAALEFEPVTLRPNAEHQPSPAPHSSSPPEAAGTLLDDAEILRRIESRSWFHSIELAPGIVTPGRVPAEYLRQMLTRVAFPERLDGMSVLDVGAWDGFFSFEAEKRGAARVVAYDLHPPDQYGFNIAREIRGSRVEYVTGSVYELSPERLGTFDVVLFFGVFYHLRYPLLALDRLRAVTKQYMLFESHHLDNRVILEGGDAVSLASIDPRLSKVAIFQFYAQNELAGDFSNWFAPNRRAIEDSLSTAGFRPDFLTTWEDRVAYRAHPKPGCPDYQYDTYEGLRVETGSFGMEQSILRTRKDPTSGGSRE